MNVKQTLNLFVEAGLVDRGATDDIMQEVASTGKSLPDVLIDYEICDERGFYQTIADAIGAEFVSLKDFEPSADLLRLVPAAQAQLHHALPLGFDDHV